jgi:hypothetical protein
MEANDPVDMSRFTALFKLHEQNKRQIYEIAQEYRDLIWMPRDEKQQKYMDYLMDILADIEYYEYYMNKVYPEAQKCFIRLHGRWKE